MFQYIASDFWETQTQEQKITLLVKATQEVSRKLTDIGMKLYSSPEYQFEDLPKEYREAVNKIIEAEN